MVQKQNNLSVNASLRKSLASFWKRLVRRFDRVYRARLKSVSRVIELHRQKVKENSLLF